jgi:hypothetical protein
MASNYLPDSGEYTHRKRAGNRNGGKGDSRLTMERVFGMLDLDLRLAFLSNRSLPFL